MNRMARAVVRLPALGTAALMAYRTRAAAMYLNAPLREFARRLLRARETTNFTYHLQDYNRRDLAMLLAHVVQVPDALVLGFFDEFETDREARFGRRIGWYALVRVLRPRTVIETGVDKGLGACVLAAALKRNAEEGHPGRYFGTDINPQAGYLLMEFSRATGRQFLLFRERPQGHWHPGAGTGFRSRAQPS